MDTIWPRLETLIIHDFRGPIFEPSALAHLPRSLTHFELYSEHFNTELEDFTCLPPGLTSLKLPLESIGSRGLLTLPKTITMLGNCLSYDGMTTLLEAPDTLPVLQELSFEPEASEQPHPLLLLAQGRRLPDTLLSLSVDCDVPQLPSKLTRYVNGGARLSVRQVASLPRTLIHLEISTIEEWLVERSDWPPGLELLKCFNTGTFDYESLERLPRSLTALAFYWKGYRPSKLNQTPQQSSRRWSPMSRHRARSMVDRESQATCLLQFERADRRSRH